MSLFLGFPHPVWGWLLLCAVPGPAHLFAIVFNRILGCDFGLRRLWISPRGHFCRLPAAWGSSRFKNTLPSHAICTLFGSSSRSVPPPPSYAKDLVSFSPCFGGSACSHRSILVCPAVSRLAFFEARNSCDFMSCLQHPGQPTCFPHTPALVQRQHRCTLAHYSPVDRNSKVSYVWLCTSEFC